MLTEICQYLRNWFEREKLYGTFTISDGALTYADGTALPLLSGQYYRLIGSVLSDGVHRWGDDEGELADETFTGAVWSMAVPKPVIDLATEIAEWQAKYGGADGAVASPYTSESVGGYSCSKGNGSGNGSQDSGISWQSVYASRLAPWRKI